MVEEARLEAVESGLTPVSPGWFVVNARDACMAEQWPLGRAEANAPLKRQWRVARPDGWSELPWSEEG
jgi:hypothetical protein